MRKFCSAFALVAVLGVMMSAESIPVDAQEKGKAKKDSPKAGTVEIYKAKDGFRFRIKDSEGKTLAIGTRGYDEEADVVKQLDLIKATLNAAKPSTVKD